MRRLAVAFGWLFVPLVVAAAPAEPAPSGLAVTASCERRSSPGRVVCELEMETDAGRIPWADVLVRTAPPFARPLRARVSVAEARARTERRVRLPVAFVATALGRGVVGLEARAVVCAPRSAGEECRTVTREVTAELVVGTEVR